MYSGSAVEEEASNCNGKSPALKNLKMEQLLSTPHPVKLLAGAPCRNTEKSSWLKPGVATGQKLRSEERGEKSPVLQA